MVNTVNGLKSKLLKDYYKNFSKYNKGKYPDKKIAWITSFAPVEILDAAGFDYYYPESYSAVMAASGREQGALDNFSSAELSVDCCSYMRCFEGAKENNLPRGTMPTPDILIATNNQCNTLPVWWNVISERLNVPLIIIDYPGENADKQTALKYVTHQHKKLIDILEQISGVAFDIDRFKMVVDNSTASMDAWRGLIRYMCNKNISPTVFFDDISFLITSRCKPETAELYTLMAETFDGFADAHSGLVKLFWIGYPLWYHPDRYFSEFLKDYRVVGSNYITWWNLDFKGSNLYERLFNAYNYTFLNLLQRSRDERLAALIEASGAEVALVLKNKSCKCDFVSAKNIAIPKTEVEIDMIDRNFADTEKIKNAIALLMNHSV